MNEFELNVVERLAKIEERTEKLPDLVTDVSDIKGRVKLLEFKAGFFGAVAGTVVVAAKALIGRNQ